MSRQSRAAAEAQYSAQPNRGTWAVDWTDQSGQHGHSGALDKDTAQAVSRAHRREGKDAHIAPCAHDTKPSDMPVAIGSAGCLPGCTLPMAAALGAVVVLGMVLL